ncbi:MAG TPA: aldo/keto reductase [Steroidobacteraceae bacterium]|jgi:aryl-alcohol dehydrogenase-like predicted oxidoreductase|nr:aldo/keto reductase [Steroidobacteraceae bacterium]
MGIDAGGTFMIGGDRPVHRMGFGAMQLPGPAVWGEAKDPQNPGRVLGRARELGIDLIDTAEAYGPEVNERQIRSALSPFPQDLLIATKCGLFRSWPKGADYPDMRPNGAPAELRKSTEGSLKRLGVERIDLQQLHRVDPAVPIEDSVGELARLRSEGKIRHIGLSEVGIEEIERARAVVPIATVQNKYNVADRAYEPVLAHCEKHGIGFMPWFPMGGGRVRSNAVVTRIAARHGALPAQVALAWLLKRSKNVLLIPGTASVSHLEENVAAADLELSVEDMRDLESAE